MKRLEGWPERLNAAIEAARHRHFVWGSHDCTLFAAGVVQQITGEDIAAPWRGRYTCELGALRIAREAGGLSKIWTSILGESVPPTRARRGDVILIESEREGWDGAAGICVGADAVFVSPEGLKFVRPIVERSITLGGRITPVEQWRCAWRVG